MLNLYHGTTQEFTKIDVNKGKGFKDFGKGFYATARKDHAESIAKKHKKILLEKQNELVRYVKGFKTQHIDAFVYNLIYDDKMAKNLGLSIKEFKEANLEWLDFILLNRRCDGTPHDYDIVIGPTADEATTAIISQYLPQLVSSNYSKAYMQELLIALKPDVFPKQYFFANQKALSTLHFANIRREIIL